MKLTTEQVEHIARLSRLEFSPQEIEQYSTELSRILNYVERLQELDTTDVPITSHITDRLTALRPDEVMQVSPAIRNALVKAFPKSNADLLAVPAVFQSYKE